MGKDTKDRILDEALVSFVENGYKGTNLRDFSAGMGLSKSALYSHFKSKEAIWNALIDKMEAYYAEHFGSAEHLPEIPKSCDEFFSLAMNMVNFTIHDEKIILTRKLLLTEQFHDDRVKKLATEHFINGTKAIYQKIFEKMIENGLLKNEDPDMLAFIFTSPVTSLIHYCDREPEKEQEIIGQIENFVQHFIKIYGIKKDSAIAMTIETERLIIKEFDLSMAKAVHENSLDDDNRKFVPDEVFETEDDARETIEFLMSQYGTENGSLVYPVFTKMNENIGYVQLSPIADGWEIGYHIAKKYTGNGYATEAVSAFLPVIAEKKSLSEIYGICLKENVASIKVMEKCGFENFYSGAGEYQGKKSEIVKNIWRKKQ